jgi:hypothetical protein
MVFNLFFGVVFFTCNSSVDHQLLPAHLKTAAVPKPESNIPIQLKTV